MKGSNQCFCWCADLHVGGVPPTEMCLVGWIYMDGMGASMDW
jgi:hypothetical protein